MKGIVMEISRSEAVVLSDDGVFTKIKNKNYSVGQVVIYRQTKKSKILAFVCAAAAALIITCGGFAYYTPTTYVSLDVNPSIAFSLNTFSRVLDVQPVDDDAKPIVGELHLKNKTIDEAMQQTIDDLIEKGYITEDDNGGVIIATSNKNDTVAQKLADRLQKKIQNTIDEQGKVADVEAEAVSTNRVQEAKSLGVTPGKLSLVQKLRESSDNPDDINTQDWLNKPVKDINKAIKENKEAAKNDKDNQKVTTSTTPQDTSTQQDSADKKGHGNDETPRDNPANSETTEPNVTRSAGEDDKTAITHENEGKSENQTNDKNNQDTKENATTTSVKTQPSKGGGNAHNAKTPKVK